MVWRFKLAPDNTTIDFLRMRFVVFTISAILVFGSLGLIAVNGLNLGVDFTGGTMIEIKTSDVPDITMLRHKIDGLGLGALSIQEFGDKNNLLIRMPQQSGGVEGQSAAVEKLKEALQQQLPGQTIDYRRVEYVGPQVGDELKRAGLFAFVLSIVGILAYIAVRFEWQFGLAAVIALIHDAIVTLGLFALTRWDFDLSTMGAVLLVAGYSINDTVVIFDRIRENIRKYRKMPLVDLLNLSTNQTLSRSLMTSFTTLLALSALAVFGGDVISGFTYALIVGIVVGTFSSTYVAGALLLYFPPGRRNDDAAAP